MTPWRARLRRYLINGVVALVPLSLSILLVAWLVQKADRVVAPFLTALLGRDIPGLGLVFTFLTLLAVGIVVSDQVGQRMVQLVEWSILQVPGLGWIYRTFKQVAEAFSPESQESFMGVVLVPYPRADVWRLGFVTKEIVAGGETLVAVYVPTNHFYIGDVALFKTSEVRPTGMTVQQAIQSTLSAGAALPEKLP